MYGILKKLTAVLSVMFLAGCEDTVIEMGFTPPEAEQTTVNQAEITENEVYNGIVQSLEDMTMVSEYKKILDSDTVSGIIEKIRSEHPEFFWIEGSVITTMGEKSEIKINIIENLSAEDIEHMSAELVSCADALISSMPSGLDNYGKVVFVHDYIVNHTTYDTAGAESDENGLFGTAYGCLVQGKAICQGYSEAFQYIMKRLGIECGVCRGDTARGRHAWNYVNLNEKYYWLDVTWDDPVPENDAPETLSHTYCLIDDERMFRTRNADSDLNFIPKCYSMDNNYFVRNGTYIAYYSDEEISAVLDRYAEAGEVEIMFADESSYSEAVSRLFGEGDIWNFIDSEEVTYTNDDVMCILKIKY